jgi:signal transduction histidine kinase
MDTRVLRTLLAEDDEDDYLITRDILSEIRRMSFELEWVPTYEAAKQAIERNEHDLYLLDYRLGSGDGLQLLGEAFRNGRPRAPVIFLTGVDDWDTDFKVMKAGAADYLVKGQFDAKLLERSIRYAVERKRAELEMKRYAEEIERKNQELGEAVRVVREAIELKNQFLANVSHEIRTPMNGVLGMTKLLLDTNLTPEQQEFTEMAVGSAEALLTIIDGILDLSKIEKGKLELENVEFELPKVVREVVTLLSGPAQNKGLKLITVMNPGSSVPLRGDAYRLRQVLLNLVGNAIKFTDHGAVSIRVRVEAGPERSVQVHCDVEDSGIGISSEAMGRLFKPFVQADGSITRKYGGSGLGLAISKQLLEMMGGEIGLESELGKGSRFWLMVPFQKAQEANSPSPRRELEWASPRGS